MADAENPMRRDRLEVELDLVEEGERPLRADEQARHVVASGVDRIDVVAAHPSEHLRKTALDLVSLAAVQRAHPADELTIALRHRAPIGIICKVAGNLTEP